VVVLAETQNRTGKSTGWMMLTRIVTALLQLYPRQFRAEFGNEMQVVIEEAFSAQQDWAGKALLLVRELRELPGSILNAYLSNWLGRGNMSTLSEYIKPSTRWQAFLGMLPFLAYGLASMLSEMDNLFDLRTYYAFIAFYLLALVGWLIGWVRGFPLCSYGYFGWSLVFAWWWTGMRTHGFDWGYLIWIPFGIMILIALVWTRSLKPLKNFFGAIWQDWSRLMLAMFALETWVMMIFDENRHPYLLAFIMASSLFASGGVWFYLRSSTLRGRIFSFLGSFIGTTIVSNIAWATWDWHAYYGFPQPEHWYQDWGISVIGVIFWFVILFWPALIGLVRRMIIRRFI
jgi:hypothetical protein